MKRDVDLSRAILGFVEEHAPPEGGLKKPIEIEGYDHPTVIAHAVLLIEDGLIDGRVLQGIGGPPHVMIIKLTNLGHDAIAAARDDTTWNKAKKAVKERGMPFTFGLIVEFLKAEARKHLPLP